MSDSDHLIIKRIVRAVLRESLKDSLDALAEQASAEVVKNLQRECGADRLYIGTDAAARRAARDMRIRDQFTELCKAQTPSTARKQIALREGISVRQIERICMPSSTEATPEQ